MNHEEKLKRTIARENQVLLLTQQGYKPKQIAELFCVKVSRIYEIKRKALVRRNLEEKTMKLRTYTWQLKSGRVLKITYRGGFNNYLKAEAKAVEAAKAQGETIVQYLGWEEKKVITHE